MTVRRIELAVIPTAVLTLRRPLLAFLGINESIVESDGTLNSPFGPRAALRWRR
jgi:hypothetical protein